MSVQTEIDRLKTAKAGLKAAIEEKGVTVPEAATLDGYGALVGQISQGTPPETCTVTIANNGTGMPPIQAYVYLVDAEGNYIQGISVLANGRKTYTILKKTFLYVDTSNRGDFTVVSGDATTILANALFMINEDTELKITK